jgi:hypothetical protein
MVISFIGWPFSGLWWTLNPFAFARWSKMAGSYLAYLLMLQVTCWLRACMKYRGLYLASFACGFVIRVILLGFSSRVPSECQPILDQGLPSACRNGTWIEDAVFCIIVCPKFWAEDCILIIYIQCFEVMGVIDCLVLCEWYSQGYDHTLFLFSGLTRNWHNICLVTLCDVFVAFFSPMFEGQWICRACSQSLINALSLGCLCSDYLFKLLLIGDSGVGKSCLLLRFAVRYIHCSSEFNHACSRAVAVGFKKIIRSLTDDLSSFRL